MFKNRSCVYWDICSLLEEEFNDRNNEPLQWYDVVHFEHKLS